MSNITDAIVSAYSKGYRVTESGEPVNPSGSRLKTRIKGRPGKGYPCFSVSHDGKSRTIPVHKLASFQLFGNAAIESGVVTRHLNDNPQDNRLANLAIGSHSENSHDRPASIRVSHAQKGGSARSKSAEFWREVESARLNGASFKALSRRFGVPLSTLSFRFSTKAKRTILK